MCNVTHIYVTFKNFVKAQMKYTKDKNVPVEKYL